MPSTDFSDCRLWCFYNPFSYSSLPHCVFHVNVTFLKCFTYSAEKPYVLQKWCPFRSLSNIAVNDCSQFLGQLVSFYTFSEMFYLELVNFFPHYCLVAVPLCFFVLTLTTTTLPFFYCPFNSSHSAEMLPQGSAIPLFVYGVWGLPLPQKFLLGLSLILWTFAEILNHPWVSVLRKPTLRVGVWPSG